MAVQRRLQPVLLVDPRDQLIPPNRASARPTLTGSRRALGRVRPTTAATNPPQSALLAVRPALLATPYLAGTMAT